MIHFFFILSLLLNAQQNEIGVRFGDFSGGLNDTLPPHLLPANESPSLLNVMVDDPPGALSKRKGYLKITDAPNGQIPQAVFTYTQTDGDQFIILFAGTSMYTTTDLSNWTLQISSFTATAVPDCENIIGDLVCTNGQQPVFYFNGSSVTFLDGSPASEANPAQGELLEFEDEVVWIGKTAANPSSVFFSDLVDPNTGNLITYKSSSAWPAANEIRVSQDDGDFLYGLKRYLGTIYAFKGNSVHRLIGDNKFNYGFQRILSQYGVRNNLSITELDNLLYFLSKDGIYKFNGITAVNVSRKIENLFEQIRQPIVNTKVNVWTSESDFNNGTFNNVTSSHTVGSLRLPGTNILDEFTDGDFTANPVWSTSAVQTAFIAFDQSSPSQIGSINDDTTTTCGGTGSNSTDTIEVVNNRLRLKQNGNCANMFIYTSATVSTGTWEYSFNMSNPGQGIDGSRFIYGGLEFFFILRSTIPGSAFDGYSFISIPNAGRYVIARYDNGVGVNIGEGSASGTLKQTSTTTIKIERTTSGIFNAYQNGNLIFQTTADTTYGLTNYLAFRYLDSYSDGTSVAVAEFQVHIDSISARSSIFVSTGEFTSDQFNAGANLSDWGIFDADREVNNGTLVFRVKTATSTTALDTTPFTVVNPGSLVSTITANQFVQWSASFTYATDLVNSPRIDEVRVFWTEGGSIDLIPVSDTWQTRYWLSFATSTVNNKRTVLVKSRSPLDAWTKFEGMQLGQFFKFADQFYAISSSTDDVYRLDYGENDNAVAIDAYWDSRDELFGLPSNSKDLQEAVLDYEGAGAYSLNILYSRNSGNSFTSISNPVIAGTGRLTKRLYMTGVNSPQFRFRIRNSEIDQPFRVYGLETYVKPYRLRE